MPMVISPGQSNSNAPLGRLSSAKVNLRLFEVLTTLLSMLLCFSSPVVMGLIARWGGLLLAHSAQRPNWSRKMYPVKLELLCTSLLAACTAHGSLGGSRSWQCV